MLKSLEMDGTTFKYDAKEIFDIMPNVDEEGNTQEMTDEDIEEMKNQVESENAKGGDDTEEDLGV